MKIEDLGGGPLPCLTVHDNRVLAICLTCLTVRPVQESLGTCQCGGILERFTRRVAKAALRVKTERRRKV